MYKITHSLKKMNTDMSNFFTIQNMAHDQKQRSRQFK